MGCFGFARGGGEDFLLGGVMGVSVRGLGGLLIRVNGVMGVVLCVLEGSGRA